MIMPPPKTDWQKELAATALFDILAECEMNKWEMARRFGVSKDICRAPAGALQISRPKYCP